MNKNCSTKLAATTAAAVTEPRPRFVLRPFFALLTALMLSLPFIAIAQPSQTYSNTSYDFKNYAAVDDGAVGTMFIPGAGAVPHYIQVDALGSLTLSKYYPSTDDQDARVVASELATGDRVVTMSVWDNSAHVNFLRILIIDAGGNIIVSKDITSTYMPGSSSILYDIYPMGSLVDGEDIYICGYVRPGYATDINPTDFTTTKEAFVLKIDRALTTISAGQTYNWQDVPLTSVNTNGDYDMALRMKMVQLAGATQLLVTGGANCFYPSTTPGIDNGVGGTMALLLDPTFLNPVSGLNNSFYLQGATPGSAVEYGMGIYDDGTNYFIMGNYANENSGGLYGFAPEPTGMWLQAIDPGTMKPAGLLSSPVVRDRALFAATSAWGLQMEPDKSTAGTLTIAGMQADVLNNCTYTPAPSFDNINPFMTNITTAFTSSGIGVTVNDWTTFLSVLGTGLFGTSNSYYALGGGTSSMAWAPGFMEQNPGYTTNYRLYAPVYDPDGVAVLNPKYIAADITRRIISCPNTDVSCTLGLTRSYTQITVPAQLYRIYSFNVTSLTTSLSDPDLYVVDEPMNELPCSSTQHRGLPAAAGTVKTLTQQAAVYPNPAADYVSVKLEGYGSTGNAMISLTDITGKNVGTLYSGRTGAIPAQLSLPQVTSGIYLVTIMIDGNSIQKQKLSIIH